MGFLLLKIKSPKVLITLQGIFYHNASEITTEYEQILQNSSYGVDFDHHLKMPPEPFPHGKAIREAYLRTRHSYKLSGPAILMIRRPMRRA